MILEQLGDYATSYHLISPDDQYDDVVSLPHLVDWYISPIKSSIEATYASTYQFGKNFNDFIHGYYSHPTRPFWIIIQVCIF